MSNVGKRHTQPPHNAAEEMATELALLRTRVAELEAENAVLQTQVQSYTSAAARLHEVEPLLATILDQLTVGVIIAASPSGQLLLQNAEATRLLGQPSGDTYAGARHADGQPFAPEEYPIARALRGEETAVDQEITYQRGDGTLITLAVHTVPIYDEHKQIIAAVSTFHDIAGQREAEVALRESEARFATIFQHSPIALSLCIGLERCILDVNDRFLSLFGYDRAAVIGTTSLDLQLWADPDERTHALSVEMRDGRVRDQQVMARTATGEVRQVLLSVEPLRLAGRDARLTALYDITDRVRAETALRESEQFARMILTASASGIYVFDLNAARFIFINAQYTRFTGYYLADLQPGDSTVFPMIHPEDMPRVIASIDQLRSLPDGETQSVEYRYRRADGVWIWCSSINAVFRRGADGTAQQLIGSMTDITARKVQEEQLRASEERFRLFIDHAPAAVAMLDREMRYLAISQRWKQDYGIEENIIGRSHYEVFPGQPDNWPAIHQRALAGSVERAHEDTMTRPDGTLTWLKWEVRPWYDSAGAVGGIVMFSENISARKQAEAVLRDHARLIDLASDAIIVHREDLGDITFWNAGATALYGWTADEARGQRTEALLQTRFPVSRAAAEAELQARGHWEGELTHTTKDGRTIVVHSRWVAPGPGEPLTGTVLEVNRDITESRRLQAQLFQAQKMESIGQLAGGVAHDFNNILTAISGYADLLAGALPNDPSLHSDLREIQKAARRATTLTRQLLTFARRQPLAAHTLNLNLLLDDVKGLLGRLLGEHIMLRTVPATDLWPVWGDASQIEQVIVNLAVNARDAMPEGGTITIETANVVLDVDYARLHMAVAPGPYAMLVVSDTGMGMSQEVQSRMFEPFFTTKAPGSGTGLGLATCYGIVMQHGGSLEVYSEINYGTVFKVYLPLAPAVSDEPRVVPPTDQHLPIGTETILMAEDEDGVRTLAARVLRDLGYTVLDAKDGLDAIAVAGAYAGQIDLLLSDVVMPRLSGPEVAVHLQAAYPELRVLLMSGYAGHGAQQRARLAAHDLLQKPFTPSTLAQAVRRALDKPLGRQR